MKVCCYMIISKRRVMAPQNAVNPTVNASVSSWAAPKVVLRLFFGAPASVRPICLSIIINFLSLDEPVNIVSIVTMPDGSKAVKVEALLT